MYPTSSRYTLVNRLAFRCRICHRLEVMNICLKYAYKLLTLYLSSEAYTNNIYLRCAILPIDFKQQNYLINILNELKSFLLKQITQKA